MATSSSKSSRQNRSTAGSRSSRRARGRAGRLRAGTMVFSRRNYVLLIVGVLVILLGYTMMRIDNQVEGFISLDVAPLIILGGYLEIIYAILWRPKEDGETVSKA